MSTYNPRWIAKARAILAALGDGTRSKASDDTTRRVMDTILRTLLKGQPLTDEQAAAFIGNIRKRTADTEFAFDGTIKLTADQVTSARKLLPQYAPGKAAGPLAGYVTQAIHDQLSDRVTLLEGLLRKAGLFPDESRSNLGSLSGECRTCDAIVAQQTAENSDFGKPKSDLTRRNVTKRHESMSSPAGGIAHEGGAAAPDERRALPSSSTHEEGNVAHGEGEAATHKPALTIWAKTNAAGKVSVSGNLEAPGTKYRVVIQGFDRAVETLQRCGGNDAWRRGFEADYRHIVMSDERQAKLGSFQTRTTGTLHEWGDSRGHQPPVKPTSAVFVAWDGNQINKAFIVEDDALIEVAMTRHIKEGEPYYKGAVQ